MEIKHYRRWIALCILGPVVIAILYSVIGDHLSSDDPSGIEYLVTFLYIAFGLPLSIFTGLVVSFLTRKDEKHQLYTLVACGAVAVCATLFLLSSILIV